METGSRTLWVSESPHLLGRFHAFDLKRLLADDYEPALDTAPPPSLAEDELLTSGRYAAWKQQQP
jgi:hypothetical protein